MVQYDLDYYDNLNYPILIEVIDDGQRFFASFPHLPGCHAEGGTPEEAIKELRRRKRIWLKDALKTKYKIKLPTIYLEVVINEDGDKTSD